MGFHFKTLTIFVFRSYFSLGLLTLQTPFVSQGNSVGQLPQETFINCADVTITKPDGTLSGTGLTIPHTISPKAYRATPKPYHRYGEGRPVCIMLMSQQKSSQRTTPKALRRNYFSKSDLIFSSLNPNDE